MTVETRFERPDDALIRDLVEAAAPDQASVSGWTVIESGSSSIVVLCGEVAVRIGRDPKAGRELLRTQRLVDLLPELAFGVPRSVGEPVERDGAVAIATQRLPGTPHPHGSGDPGKLRRLLESIHGIDVDPLRPWLAEPHAFSGGESWLEVITEQVIPLFPQEKRALAAEIVAAARELPTLRDCLNHGDLAGSNMLWDNGEVAAVLDWDLASACDPADDVASLAGWHGWSMLDELTDPATAERAATLRRTYPLQIVAFAVTHGRGDDEVRRAVGRATARLA